MEVFPETGVTKLNGFVALGAPLTLGPGKKGFVAENAVPNWFGVAILEWLCATGLEDSGGRPGTPASMGELTTPDLSIPGLEGMA